MTIRRHQRRVYIPEAENPRQCRRDEAQKIKERSERRRASEMMANESRTLTTREGLIAAGYLKPGTKRYR